MGFFLLHFGSILLCVYMVWGSGMQTVGGWLGQTWSVTDPDRGQLLVLVAGLYCVRHTVTLFYLLVRKVEWGEVFGLSLFMMIFEVTLCALAAGAFRAQPVPFGLVDVLAVALILFGSFLNTGSEVQRKWWKRNPENKGHCYTEGLFRWSMHINYFGDTVLFIGWCLLTATWWTLVLPVLMAASFVFFHIPGLDSYLEDRYGDEFVEYAKKTKKFMPFIY
jgi:steroid 5-alpha reductase family enzyme